MDNLHILLNSHKIFACFFVRIIRDPRYVVHNGYKFEKNEKSLEII